MAYEHNKHPLFWERVFVIASRDGLSLERIFAADDAQEYEYNRDYQQNVDESGECERCDHAQEPQDDENNCDGRQHNKGGLKVTI